MHGPPLNNQKDRPELANHKPLEEFDKDIRIHPTLLFDHEPHMTFRGDRRNQADAIARAGALNNRGGTSFTQRPAGMMIRPYMHRITKIYVRTLCFSHLLDLWVLALQPFFDQRLIALNRLMEQPLRDDSELS
jgi:hypothetical protein